VIAARIAGEWRTRDGYVENLNPNQEEELYAQDQLGVRASIRYTPTADFTLDLIGTYDQQRNGGTPFISGTFPAFAGAPGGPANAFENANLGGFPAGAAALGDDQLGLNREVYDLNITAEYSISDEWTFTTVNGYREFDSLEVFDADGSAAPFLEFTEFAKGWQVSHEGRFSYAGEKLRASAGWNLFIEDGFQNVPFATEEGVFLTCLGGLFSNPRNLCVAPDGSVPALGATNIPYSAVLFQNEGRNEAYSVFFDATWIPTDSLELTAGVRFLDEYRQSSFSNEIPNSVLTGAPLVPGGINTGGRVLTGDEEFQAVLPRFNALFRISDDVNVYGTVSKGRRSPVVQINARRDGTSVVANRIDVDEEIVWNYEGGIKLASGPVSASLGVYYQVYDNFQVSIPDVTRPGTNITVSAGSASNLGVEGELAIDLADWFTVFGNFGYIDGGVDDDPANGNLAGSRFRLQPELQASGGFTVDYEFGNGARFFATPTITHRSTIFFQVPNSALLSQGPVTLVNARAGISFAEERFEIAGFIRNALDEDFLLDAGNTGGAFGIPTFIPGEPQFYGVEVTAKF
jgi:outer membrane receptor protein involved in Fe transport